MEIENANIFLNAMSRVNKKLEIYGEGNIANISLLKLIYKYKEYSPSYDCELKINDMISHLSNCDDDICIDLKNGIFYLEDEIPVVEKNIAPVIFRSSIKDMESNLLVLNFTQSDFTPDFYDANGDNYGKLEIITLPYKGILKYNGNPVVLNQIILDISLLTYEREGTERYSFGFAFRVYDDNINPLPSNIAEIDVDVLDYIKPDEKVVMGSVEVFSTSEEESTIMFSDLISNLDPPNNDIDNTFIDRIRIDLIPDTNEGYYKFKGSDIYEGLIMSDQDLISGYLKYYYIGGYNSVSDYFEFSARDSRTGIFNQ